MDEKELELLVKAIAEDFTDDQLCDLNYMVPELGKLLGTNEPESIALVKAARLYAKPREKRSSLWRKLMLVQTVL